MIYIDGQRRSSTTHIQLSTCLERCESQGQLAKPPTNSCLLNIMREECSLTFPPELAMYAFKQPSKLRLCGERKLSNFETVPKGGPHPSYLYFEFGVLPLRYSAPTLYRASKQHFPGHPNANTLLRQTYMCIGCLKCIDRLEFYPAT